MQSQEKECTKHIGRLAFVDDSLTAAGLEELCKKRDQAEEDLRGSVQQEVPSFRTNEGVVSPTSPWSVEEKADMYRAVPTVQQLQEWFDACTQLLVKIRDCMLVIEVSDHVAMGLVTAETLGVAHEQGLLACAEAMEARRVIGWSLVAWTQGMLDIRGRLQRVRQQRVEVERYQAQSQYDVSTCKQKGQRWDRQSCKQFQQWALRR